MEASCQLAGRLAGSRRLASRPLNLTRPAFVSLCHLIPHRIGRRNARGMGVFGLRGGCLMMMIMFLGPAGGGSMFGDISGCARWWEVRANRDGQRRWPTRSLLITGGASGSGSFLEPRCSRERLGGTVMRIPSRPSQLPFGLRRPAPGPASRPPHLRLRGRPPAQPCSWPRGQPATRTAQLCSFIFGKGVVCLIVRASFVVPWPIQLPPWSQRLL